MPYVIPDDTKNPQNYVTPLQPDIQAAVTAVSGPQGIPFPQQQQIGQPRQKPDWGQPVEQAPVYYKGKKYSGENPYLAYFPTNKYLKPTEDMLYQAQNWENQNVIKMATQEHQRIADAANNFTVTEEIINALPPDDVYRSILQPGMKLPVSQMQNIYKNIMSNAGRESVKDLEPQAKDVLSKIPDTDPSKPIIELTLTNAIKNGDVKTLTDTINKVMPYITPKAKTPEEVAKIKADTAKSEATTNRINTLLPYDKNALIARANKLQTDVDKTVNSSKGKTSPFVKELQAQYRSYISSQVAAANQGQQVDIQDFDTWAANNEYIGQENLQRFYNEMTGNQSQQQGPPPLTNEMVMTIVRKHRGTGKALSFFMSAAGPDRYSTDPIVLALLAKYNKDNNLKYTPKSYYDKWVAPSKKVKK